MANDFGTLRKPVSGFVRPKDPRRCEGCSCPIQAYAEWCEDCYRAMLERWNYEGSGVGLGALYRDMCQHGNREGQCPSCPFEHEEGRDPGRPGPAKDIDRLRLTKAERRFIERVARFHRIAF